MKINNKTNKLLISLVTKIGRLVINVVSFIYKAIKFLVFEVVDFSKYIYYKLISIYKKLNKVEIKSPKISLNKIFKRKAFYNFGFSNKNKKWVGQYSQVSPSKKKKRIFGFQMFLFGFVTAIILVFIPTLFYIWFLDLPNPDLIVKSEFSRPTKILDREGKLLYEIYIDKEYNPINLDRVPKHMIDATIAVEDDTFYTHHGFDIESIFRAAKATLLDDNLQGGSTITQQLVKNVLLTPERTLSRKIKELVLSIIVEAKYSKNEILELYMNNISYGGNSWGVQSAAQRFFGKNAWELSLSESSLLAGLPSAPTTYSPFGGDLDIAKGRQKYVLDRMYQLGMITRQESENAYNEPLVFAKQVEYIRAPHFVSYVRKLLEEEFGRRFVEFGGLTVTTSLDLDLQDEVQDIVAQQVAESSRYNISNGAAVVLDTKNADILAYVGSIDYFINGWGAFDVASAYRQPGSSIKPLTYALALEQGMTPASTIVDAPVSYRIPGQQAYTPKNYDGKYHGRVTLRAALANSYNIPAVKLADRVGPDNIVQLGQDMGLEGWEVDGSYGLAVTLGGKEVRLLDLTNAYATFGRKGNFRPTSPILSIKDSKDFEIFIDHRSNSQVISQEVAYLIWNILSDNRARLPAFGSRNSLEIPEKRVAVKTGTTDQIRDNLTLGFTPSYTVGVWVGNNDNTPLDRNLASGISGAAPMWNKIMTLILEDKPDEPMVMPEGVYRKFDEKCGVGEYFVKGSSAPSSLCPEPKDGEKDDNSDGNFD